MRIITRDFIIVSAINFTVYLVYYLQTVVLIDYAVNTLHTAPGIAGLAAGIFILAGMLGRVLSGRLGSLLDIRKVLGLGLFLLLGASILLFPAQTITAICTARFLQGLGFGFASTATGTIVAHVVPRERHHEGIGYYALGVTLASAVGPFLGISLFRLGYYRIILLLGVLISAGNCAASLFLREQGSMAPSSEARVSVQTASFWTKYLEPRALPVALLAGCMGFAFSGIVGFLTPYTRQIGLLETSKYFFLVYAATILVSRPFTGRRADRKGPDAVLYPAVFLFAIGLCLLGFVDRASSVLFAGLLIGLGYGSFTPVAQVVAVRRAPLERVGLATSTFFAIFDVGAGLGYFLLGSLVPLLGLSGLFPCMAAFVLAGLCVFGYFQTRRKRFRIWRLYRNWKDWALNLRPSPEQ